MRYYTRDWYIRSKAAGISMGLSVCTAEEAASNEFYEKLFAQYTDDIRFECEQIKNTSFDVFAEDRLESRDFLQAEFDRWKRSHDPDDAEFTAVKRLSQTIANLKMILPQDILAKIPDIRIFALRRTTPEIMRITGEYADRCREEIAEINFAFEEEYSAQTDEIPDEIWKEYGFAGGHIRKMIRNGNDIDIMIDNYGSGSDVTALHLRGCIVVQTDEGLDGAEWVMNEIYLNDGIYTLCALCRSGNALPEFTIRAAEVFFTYDR